MFEYSGSLTLKMDKSKAKIETETQENAVTSFCDIQKYLCVYSRRKHMYSWSGAFNHYWKPNRPGCCRTVTGGGVGK